jgi:Protein of unknown function (DUF3455)
MSGFIVDASKWFISEIHDAHARCLQNASYFFVQLDLTLKRKGPNMLYRIALMMVAGFLVAADAAKDAVLEKELERLRIPEKLTPKGKRALFLVRAEGVQKYRAEQKAGELQWVLQGPEAVLFDYKTGEKVGTHSKGPNGPIWVDSDGGKLTGKVRASEPAPNPQAIPWLLLDATSENGGRFAKVTQIQRVDTWAGQAPAGRPESVKEAADVHYQATYVFWGD